MATSSEKNKILKLSQAEYTTLSTTGTLTKDGVTYTYSPSDTIYVTPDNMSKRYATITDNSTVALADNTEYSGSNLTTVTFTYPSGNFECYMSLSFASSGTITVTFPTSQYIGSVPTFENGKTWETSIRNGVIVAGKVDSGA
jgi:hypothetical protein